MLRIKQVRHTLFFFTLPLATLASFAYFTTARAQITPDNTLGAENSRVTQDVIKGIPSDRIDGGATRGANLFHSFQEFNINAGRGAYFSNPAGIANILSRVTGGNPSNIQGILGVLGKANLFFINPNGIIFGPNARLDVGSSFFGSTANSLIFKDGFEFSATNPQAPPLLTINIPNIPIGMRFRENPGNITNQSRAVDTNGNLVGLTVPSGNSLTLVGGNVSLDNGILFAPGGRVELGGLSAAGTVGLNGDGSLSFPVGVQRADVSLTNGAEVAVTSGGGGSIAVNARNLDISGGSGLYAGIGQGLGSIGSQAGDITLDATGEIKVVGSGVLNNVASQGVGNSGNINITTGSFSLTDGAQVSASTFGQGNAGNVSVRATDSVELAGSNTSIFSAVEAGGVGKGGNIDINAASLSLKDGAQLVTIVREASGNQLAGQGDAGNVTVNVTGPVTIAGVGIKSGNPSAIFSSVNTGAMGNGGNITISSGSFSLTDGAQVSASTDGKGDAGSVSVRASGPVELAGSNTSIFSSVDTGAMGNGGNITISSGSFSLSDGAQLIASTFGQGNAGNVTVDVTGPITIVGVNDKFSSAILSAVEAGGVGKGGNINIKAASLSLKDGAQLVTIVREASSTQSGGRGDAGNVTVNVTGPVTIAGVKNGLPSGIRSSVGTGATGNGGKITISSGSFSLTDGAELSVSTFGQGNAGSVLVRAKDSVELAGSGTYIFSNVESTGVGKGGNININASSLSLKDGAQLVVSTFGQGDAGNVTVDVTGPVTIVGVNDKFSSAIASTVEAGGVGKGGNININAASLSLRDGAQLLTIVREASSTQSGGRGNAGNVTVNVTGPVTIAGVKNGLPSGIRSSVGTGATGNGGKITISSGSFSLTDGAQLEASTFGQGDSGNVTVNVIGPVTITGQKDGLFSGIFSLVQTEARGNGGNITISSGSLSLSDSGRLSASTLGQGNAGNVTVDVKGPVTITGVKNGFPSAISSGVDTGATGNAGGIDITARSLSVTNDGIISTSNFGNGAAGNITVTTTKDIRLDNQASINADTGGGQGNITLNSRDLILRRNSNITTNATGTARGGNITINTGNLVALEDSNITANAERGFGGEVIITTTGGRFLSPDSDITAFSEAGPQFSGTVQFNTPDTDPSRGLFELPETVIDPAQQIAQNPCLRGDGEFVITGRGGFPTNPSQ
ncbi:MAG: filamentous hemagglutinin N-terminal domain-containing protein, partial [Iphinoe sp. HA4291-MV1]|nr:filamentous hemagglutinin N-terminal domain-containing protein [Iphinoe sp. HA4291-MV1]